MVGWILPVCDGEISERGMRRGNFVGASVYGLRRIGW
jgi:hypothetical protein